MKDDRLNSGSVAGSRLVSEKELVVILISKPGQIKRVSLFSHSCNIWFGLKRSSAVSSHSFQSGGRLFRHHHQAAARLYLSAEPF